MQSPLRRLAQLAPLLLLACLPALPGCTAFGAIGDDLANAKEEFREGIGSIRDSISELKRVRDDATLSPDERAESMEELEGNIRDEVGNLTGGVVDALESVESAIIRLEDRYGDGVTTVATGAATGDIWKILAGLFAVATAGVGTGTVVAKKTRQQTEEKIARAGGVVAQTVVGPAVQPAATFRQQPDPTSDALTEILERTRRLEGAPY